MSSKLVNCCVFTASTVNVADLPTVLDPLHQPSMPLFSPVTRIP